MAESKLAVPRSARMLDWLREARWLHRGRMRAYAQLFLFATVLVGVLRVLLANTHVAFLGGILHEDYLSFWSAGRQVLMGHAVAVYDEVQHNAVNATAYVQDGYEAFYYPPVYLLLCAPLALLPFYPSSALFLGATLIGYWRALARLLPGADVALLGFPAVTMNLIYGQNGFLTTALFAAALAALPRRAALAGLCFGCLCYKPHLGLAVPLALVAARQWRTLVAAGATVLVLAAASVAAFGLDTWQGFFAGTAAARRTLELGLVDNSAWVSTFRAMVQAGAGLSAAYAVQATVSLLVLAALAVACRRRPGAITGLLPLAALLATPFLLVYDLTLLAIPMAWLVVQARRGGFLPWERAALGFAYIMPLAAPFAARIGVPLGPPAMLALFAVALRRAWRMSPG